MHPVLGRYMDFATAWGAWRRRSGEPGGPGEAAFVASARARPDLWSAVERAEGRTHPPDDAQNALLVLAAHTAATLLGDDARVAPALARATGALEAEGATEEQIRGLVGAVLLEEAFGDDAPADGFDAAFVAESLETLAELATLGPERVAGLEDAFATGGAPAEQRLRRLAAQTLCGVAWADGPDLVTREHVEEAAGKLPPEGLPPLAEFVDHLADVQLVGPLRRGRLRRALADLGVEA